mgnify:CR=1 FL=1
MRNKTAADVCTDGNQIKKYLLTHGMTQAELSRRSGVGNAKISDIVCGKTTMISSVTAELICRAFCLPVNVVFPTSPKVGMPDSNSTS